MYGDFSRLPFRPEDYVTRVLFNQGQPLIEADLNEALSAVSEQATYRADVFETTSTMTTDNKVRKISTGTTKSPVGGFSIRECLQIDDFNKRFGGVITILTGESKSFCLELSQHPFSLAHVRSRSGSRSILHAAEIWGLKCKIVDVEKWVDVLEPPSASFKLTEQIHGSIVRVEYHGRLKEESGEKKQYGVFKLDVDNGGYANEIRRSDPDWELKPGYQFVRIPTNADYIEIQKPVGKFVIAGDQSRICKISSFNENVVREGELVSNSNSFVAAGDDLQCRFWSEVKAIVVPSSENTVENWLVIKFEAVEFTIPGKQPNLEAGMSWTVSANELNAQFAQQQKDKGNAKIDSVVGKSAQRVFRIKLSENANAPAAPAPAPICEASTQTLDSRLACFDSVFCTRLVREVNSPHVRRWLASMTVGELAMLSDAELRRCIVEDCRIKPNELKTIENDLVQVIARRDQLVGLKEVAYA